MFYVGEKEYSYLTQLKMLEKKILKAILEVTKLPVTTIVYSHAHADHISSAPVIVEASKRQVSKYVLFHLMLQQSF